MKIPGAIGAALSSGLIVAKRRPQKASVGCRLHTFGGLAEFKLSASLGRNFTIFYCKHTKVEKDQPHLG
eukprot:4675406-Prymnesium_polylepis.1